MLKLFFDRPDEGNLKASGRACFHVSWESCLGLDGNHRIGNHMRSKVWDGITYPFQNNEKLGSGWIISSQTSKSMQLFIPFGINSSPIPLLSHICVGELGHHWFRQWRVAYWAPSHYLNQCWAIVNWTLGNKCHGNFNTKYKSFHSRKSIWKYHLWHDGHFG